LKAVVIILDDPRIYTQTSAEDHKLKVGCLRYSCVASRRHNEKKYLENAAWGTSCGSREFPR
jgi:hypothetical protein